MSDNLQVKFGVMGIDNKRGVLITKDGKQIFLTAAQALSLANRIIEKAQNG